MSQIIEFRLLAEYNQLMNRRQYQASSRLSTTELCENKGAFFKSVLGTLNHLLVGDIIWLQRFAAHPSSQEALSYLREQDKPKSLDTILYADFYLLKNEREKIDEIIIDWINQLSEKDLSCCISYTNMSGTLFSKRFSNLINHIFLHQVHHRGQITTLLSQSGVDFGETDILEIIGECYA